MCCVPSRVLCAVTCVMYCHMCCVLSLVSGVHIDMLVFQFIDMCILLGCDYCDSIRGIGPKRAVDLIKQHRTIEGILKHIDTKVWLSFALFHQISSSHSAY